MLKTGSEHVQSLKDGRQVFINGQVVADVSEHPAFRRTVQSVGTLFDFASRPDNVDLMTFETPDGGGQRANRIWQLPQNYEDLVVRRRALEAWAELHGGFLGRAPDHVASCLSGMVMGIDVFEAYDRARAGALGPKGNQALKVVAKLLQAGLVKEIRARAGAPIKDFFDLTSGRRQPRPGEKSGLVYSRFNNGPERRIKWRARSMLLARTTLANRP